MSFFGYFFGLCSITEISANALYQMYSLYHPSVPQSEWHIYIIYVILLWMATVTILFGNRFVPLLNKLSMFLVLSGVIVTVIVVLAMPKKLASSAFVWKTWQNSTGWSGGVAFLTGCLNGAFTVGTSDAVAHMSEELDQPERTMPMAVAVQLGLGFLTTFVYIIAILYSIDDFDAVMDSGVVFPLAVVYEQAAGKAGACGLLFIVFLCIYTCVFGSVLAVSFDKSPFCPQFLGSQYRLPLFQDSHSEYAIRTVCAARLPNRLYA